MSTITRTLVLAVAVCVALPILARVAAQLLPLIATALICAVLFTVLTGGRKR